MSLERDEVVGYMSDHLGSDRIVEGRFVDRRHAVVYQIPSEDTSMYEDAFDVTLRDREDEELVDHANPDLVMFSDEGDPKNPATEEYRSHTSGVPVTHEDIGNTETRYVVTTRNDGRIRIQGSNPDAWEASVYGRDYSSEQAASKRYEKLS